MRRLVRLLSLIVSLVLFILNIKMEQSRWIISVEIIASGYLQEY